MKVRRVVISEGLSEEVSGSGETGSNDLLTLNRLGAGEHLVTRIAQRWKRVATSSDCSFSWYGGKRNPDAAGMPTEVHCIG